jgi:adenylate kinase
LCPNIPGEGYRPTTPTALARRQPRGILLLQTSYRDLLALRKKRDHKRDRTPPTEQQFHTDTFATLAAAMSLASALGVPCFVCQNEVGALDTKIAECVAVARKFL